jgi:DNA-directed RNA polymerase specialized sigma24 family protein
MPQKAMKPPGFGHAKIVVCTGRFWRICSGGSYKGTPLAEDLESSPPLPASPEQAEYYDKAEVLAAFVALPAADLAHLMRYARLRMFPLSGRLRDADAQDLLHEALVKTLDGTRRWRRAVPLDQHLVGCMSSIANNWFEQAGKFQDIQGFEGSSADADASPDLASQFDAQEKIDQIRRVLEEENDATALSVLDTMLDGRTPAEAKALLGINDGVYWAARKLVRRRAERLFRRREGAIDG